MKISPSMCRLAGCGTKLEQLWRFCPSCGTEIRTRAAVARKKPENRASIDTAISVIASYGDAGIAAGDFGARMWPNRTSKATSMGGGGDYAAQMLLGRLRKQGLVRVRHDSITSIWELTAAGRKHAREQ